MKNNGKEFNFKIYGAVTFFVVAALLVTMCTVTFRTRYIAFDPGKLAVSYVDTIVQTGDGYNAYKNTLVSKNYKYGDFIREYYITPAVYRDTQYKPGDDTDDYCGYNDESFKGEKTLNDDGTLNGQLIDAMYPYYEQLVKATSWYDYDTMFTTYINNLIHIREQIFEDKYFSDEVFFTAFEANVATFGDYLTGTDDVFDENSGVQLSEKSEGLYEKQFGEDYKFNIYVKDEQKEIDIDSYLAQIDADKLSSYGVAADEISQVKELCVVVEDNNALEVATVNVVVVKIDSSWYVDNINTDTANLFDIV